MKTAPDRRTYQQEANSPWLQERLNDKHCHHHHHHQHQCDHWQISVIRRKQEASSPWLNERLAYMYHKHCHHQHHYHQCDHWQIIGIIIHHKQGVISCFIIASMHWNWIRLTERNCQIMCDFRKVYDEAAIKTLYFQILKVSQNRCCCTNCFSSYLVLRSSWLFSSSELFQPILCLAPRTFTATILTKELQPMFAKFVRHRASAKEDPNILL